MPVSSVSVSCLLAGGFRGPTPSADTDAQSVPHDHGDLAPLQPGTYVTADHSWRGSPSRCPPAGQGHLGALSTLSWVGAGEVAISIFDKVYADPCQFDKGILNPSPGTLGGRSCRPHWSACQDSTSPHRPTSPRWLPGQAAHDDCTVRLHRLHVVAGREPPHLGTAPRRHLRHESRAERPGWILDVDGPAGRDHRPGYRQARSAQTNAEIQAVLDSIRIAPAPPTASPS